MLAAFAVAASSCARRVDPSLIPHTKVLVAGFEVPTGIRENTREVRGWWFGAETIRQNPRAGRIFAESLNYELSRYSYIKPYSNFDLKYYIASKRDLLRESYSHLEDEEIEDLLRGVDPILYARELRSDMLLTGRIIQSHLHQNRTFDWWKSIVHVECQLIDVVTGDIKWQKEYKRKGRFASTITVQEEICREIGEDLEREYFAALASIGEL